MYVKIIVIVLILIALAFTFQLFLSSEPFSRAVDEVCCLNPDGSLSYVLGEECVNGKHGKIVNEQLCFDYFLSE